MNHNYALENQQINKIFEDYNTILSLGYEIEVKLLNSEHYLEEQSMIFAVFVKKDNYSVLVIASSDSKINDLKLTSLSVPMTYEEFKNVDIDNYMNTISFKRTNMQFSQADFLENFEFFISTLKLNITNQSNATISEVILLLDLHNNI